MTVVPYVTDTKNALIVRPETVCSHEVMAGLQSALRVAIQQYFQLESRELVAEALPSARNRREILLYEASEGGAGVLRQIVDDPTVLPALARLALIACHFDPNTLQDLAAERCGKACYECLLDYGNQPDHRLLDRLAIRDLLVQLMHATCQPATGVASAYATLPTAVTSVADIAQSARVTHMAALRAQSEVLPSQWLDRLEELMLTPPSDALWRIAGLDTRATFYYRDSNTVIFVDGPDHEEPEVAQEDDSMTQRLLERGYTVVRFDYRDDWDVIFAQHSDIFGVIRS